MNRKRESCKQSSKQEQKRLKLNFSKTKTSPSSSSQEEEDPVNLRRDDNSDSYLDKEIPETPPEGSPASIISASPPHPSPADTQSMVNLIEDSTPEVEDEEPPGYSGRELEKSLIQEIESCSSSSADDFDLTTLIESDSGEEGPSSLGRTQSIHIPASISQRPPGHRVIVQRKDPVDIPLTINAAKHPLAVITARPLPLRNGLADDLKKVLVDYRSKENFWQYDQRTGIADPEESELVHVKSIKKFHSYCLLVEVQRDQGQGEGDGDERHSSLLLLLNSNWDVSFREFRVGDKLIVNFRKTEPMPLTGKLVHFFPFVRRQI